MRKNDFIKSESNTQTQPSTSTLKIRTLSLTHCVLPFAFLNHFLGKISLSTTSLPKHHK